MTVEWPLLLRDIAAQLHQRGHILISNFKADETTIAVASSLGEVADIPALLPQSGIPTVQELRPRLMTETGANKYSGNFGLGDFPLHTDLAHWAQPPRYFLLRCKVGSPTVVTRLLPLSALIPRVGAANLRRALVRPSRPPRGGVICILPVTFRVGEIEGIRWDSLFLVPMNNAAGAVAQALSDITTNSAATMELALVQPGDTLIVDNWHCLHGRGKVWPNDRDRKVERVYLTKLHI